MKYLILSLFIALFTVTLNAEYISSTMSEEEIIEVANTKSYPGGLDEDELSVQKDTLEAKQHVTAATLQWRAQQALTRDTAATKNNDQTSD